MKKLTSVRTIILAGSLLLQLSTLCFYSHAAPGDVDLSFDPGSGVNGPVNALAVQPDGKVIIGGDFTTVKGLVRTNLARLNADGSGDGSFDPGAALYSIAWDRPVRSIAIQPDGKMLVGHNYGIDRFNSDGSSDTNFNGAVHFTPVLSIALQADGKVLIGGYFTTVNGTNNNTGIARLKSDGSLDDTFNAKAFAPYEAAEYQEFYPVVNSIAFQSDGKVLAGGDFDDLNGTNRSRIVRFNGNGTLDGSFNPSLETPNGPVHSVAVQSDGKVLIGGTFSTANGMSRNGIARLNANGTVDGSFNPGTGTNSDIRSVVLEAGGNVLIGGTFFAVNGANTNHGVARLNANGSLDSTFNPGTGVNGSVRAIALQSDGKVFIGGLFTTVNGTNRNRMARLNTNGSLDGGFHPGRGLSSSVASLVLQPDGKVLIGDVYTFISGTNQYGSARLNADGSLDESFAERIFPLNLSIAPENLIVVRALCVQVDGKVLLGGHTRAVAFIDEFGAFYYSFRAFLARVHADGTADPGFQISRGDESFDWNPDSFPPRTAALVIQPDGKVLFAGPFNAINGTNRNGIARFNANGSLDASFNPSFSVSSVAVHSLALQPDGKVLVGGSFAYGAPPYKSGIARLNPNGSPDGTFNPGTGANGTVFLVLSQPDGKALIAGTFTSVNGISRNRIARLDNNGSVDESFNPGTGANRAVGSIALQSDGNVLISGDFLTVNGVVRPHVARLYGDPVVPSLNIARSNAFVIVSWPAAALNFRLQESTDLSPPNAWSPVAQSTITNAGQISVTLPTTGGRKFFRLKSQ